MIKWEYDILYISPDEHDEEIVIQLDSLGSEGWEHYAISGKYYFLKRPIQPVNALGDESQMGKVESVELKAGYWNG